MISYRQMRTEHLGSEATEIDLIEFREAVERVLPAFESDVAATDYIWGNGDCFKRLSAGWCCYCERLVADAVTVPATDDDAEWQRLAGDHGADCEWVVTRAHRIR